MDRKNESNVTAHLLCITEIPLNKPIVLINQYSERFSLLQSIERIRQERIKFFCDSAKSSCNSSMAELMICSAVRDPSDSNMKTNSFGIVSKVIASPMLLLCQYPLRLDALLSLSPILCLHPSRLS